MKAQRREAHGQGLPNTDKGRSQGRSHLALLMANAAAKLVAQPDTVMAAEDDSCSSKAQGVDDPTFPASES